MAKAYIGADNVAKLVKKMYIGVDGVARKVTKAYRGVDGVAKLVYSGEIPKKEYLYGGTSTFVHTGDFYSSRTDYELSTDEFSVNFTKYDTTPLYVYFDNELVRTSTTTGNQSITLSGAATALDSKDSITVTITSEGPYSLGSQRFYQYWEYTGSDKYTNNETVSSKITSFILSDNVTGLLSSALGYITKDCNVSIPTNGIVTLGNRAFAGCPLSTITIPESVTSMGAEIFYDCNNITTIELPEWLTSIGNYMFYSCDNLTSLNIPENVTSIGAYAFYNCGELTSLNIPEKVSQIGSNAFYNCSSLPSITIPNGVSKIGSSTFYSCSDLTSINIPKSVTTIESRAFSSCSRLKDITFEHGASDPLSIAISSETPSDSAFYLSSALATNVYHNGNEAVLNYDWATCNRTVTFIQE